MTAVFIDTVALIAIWNDSDQWHAIAQRTYSELRSQRAELITTRYVLLECGNALARTPIRNELTALRKTLEKSNRLIAPEEDDWNVAWAAYDHGDSGDASIVDQVSFAVMRRLGINRAFANDWHFAAAGFETLF